MNIKEMLQKISELSDEEKISVNVAMKLLNFKNTGIDFANNEVSLLMKTFIPVLRKRGNNEDFEKSMNNSIQNLDPEKNSIEMLKKYFSELVNNEPSSFLIFPIKLKDHVIGIGFRKIDGELLATIIDTQMNNGNIIEINPFKNNEKSLETVFNLMIEKEHDLEHKNLYQKLVTDLGHTYVKYKIKSGQQKNSNCVIKQPTKLIKFFSETSKMELKDIKELKNKKGEFTLKFKPSTQEVHLDFINELIKGSSDKKVVEILKELSKIYVLNKEILKFMKKNEENFEKSSVDDKRELIIKKFKNDNINDDINERLSYEVERKIDPSKIEEIINVKFCDKGVEEIKEKLKTKSLLSGVILENMIGGNFILEAFKYKDDKNFKKATEYFSQAIKMDPENSYYYSYLGNNYVSMGKYSEGKEQYDIGIEKSNFKCTNCFLGRASYYLIIEKYKEALSDFKMLYKLDKNIDNYVKNIYLMTNSKENSKEKIERIKEMKRVEEFYNDRLRGKVRGSFEFSKKETLNKIVITRKLGDKWDARKNNQIIGEDMNLKELESKILNFDIEIPKDSEITLKYKFKDQKKNFSKKYSKIELIKFIIEKNENKEKKLAINKTNENKEKNIILKK